MEVTTVWTIVLLAAGIRYSDAYYEYGHYDGNVQYECPQDWIQVADLCFKVSEWKLPWLESNSACNTPQYLYSKSFTLSNTFLLNYLVERLQEVFYWTGYYVNVDDNGVLSTDLNGLSPVDTRSIFDPVWADTQPRVIGDDRIQCVLFGSEAGDSDTFGWHLENCSTRYPTICQTFACIKDVTLRCNDNTKCYPVANRLNGVQDCPDNSDEINDSANNCKYILNEAKGIITLPKYTISKALCSWQIGTDKNVDRSLIVVELHNHTLEETDLIGVEFSDINPNSKTVKYMPLSHDYPQKFSFVCSTLILKVNINPSSGTDNIVKNFTIKYDVQEERSCSETFIGNGSWSLPKTATDDFLYPADLYCDARIENSNNDIMTIKILDFQVAEGDRLMIYDGEYDRNNLFGEFSNDLQPPTLLFSNAAELNFIFQSKPDSIGAPGFRIVYRQGCIDEQLTADYGQFETPAARFPSRRIPFQCSWFLKIPCEDSTGCQFTLQISQLNLTNQDAVTLSSGGSSYLVTIDDTAPLRYRSTTNVISVDVVAKSNAVTVVGTFSIDCPVLEVDENTQVVYSYGQQYNSVATFSCINGYHLVGIPNISCEVNGHWSDDIPTCVETICVLPIILNGFITNVTGYTVNSKLWYDCQLGYNLTSDYSVCNNDGLWSPTPFCQNISCGMPETDYNGCTLYNISGANLLYSKAFYSRLDPLHFFGLESPFRVCQTNGFWSTPNFSCKPVHCFSISVPYGKMVDKEYNVGDECAVQCDYGFQVVQLPKCLENGSWSFRPKCEAYNLCTSALCYYGRCSPLIGGYNCECSPGYTLQQNTNTPTATCIDIDECNTNGYSLCDGQCVNNDGSYDCRCPAGKQLYIGDMLTDIVVNTNNLVANRSCYTPRCTDLTIPNNTLPYAVNYTVQNGLYLVGTTYTFVCNLQFTYTTKYTTMKCGLDINGFPKWEQFNDCSEDYDACKPNELNNGVTVTPAFSLYKNGTLVSFACENSSDYDLVGYISSRCSGTNWTNEWPSCLKKGIVCQELIYNETTTVRIANPSAFTTEQPEDKVLGRESAYFVCREGYSFITGDEHITLTCENGKWNGIVPECIEKQCTFTVPADILPQKTKLYFGETTTFSCIGKGKVINDTAPVSCGFNADLKNTKVSSPSAKSCIQEISSTVQSGLGSEVILWCILAEDCTSSTILWRWRTVREDLAPQTIQYSPHSIGLYFQNVQFAQQGNYECVVKEGDYITEIKATTLTVDPTLQPYNWMNILNSIPPEKDEIFRSTAMTTGWQHSAAWSMNADDYSWTLSRSSREEWLISPVVMLTTEHLKFLLNYDAKRCVGCYLKLMQFSTDQPLNTVTIERFFTVQTLETNRTTMQLQLTVQKKFLYIGLQSKGLIAKIYSINLQNISCPEIHLAHGTFKRSGAKTTTYSVVGHCANSAITVPDRSPQLYCTPNGRWLLANLSSISCLCPATGYVDTLFDCIKELKCYNSQSTVACTPDKKCFTEVVWTSETERTVTKGCKTQCISSFRNLTACLSGNESCTICCSSDYCNWSPGNNRSPRILGSIPQCLSSSNLSIKCQKTLDVIRYDMEFARPVVVPVPEVHDTNINFNLTSSVLTLGSQPYVFPSSINSIVWKAQNNYGRVASCVTKINHIDIWPPVVQCPKIVETFESDLRSSETTLLLPTVNVVDFSEVYIETNPRNLSSITINRPIFINLTATDYFNNVASCSFWYRANSLDCSPFMTKNDEFQCEGDAKRLRCWRKAECNGREYPSKEFLCTSGAPTNNTSYNTELLRVQKNIFPLCIRQKTPVMVLECTIKLGNLNGNKCLSLFLFEIQKAFNNEMSQYTDQTWKGEVIRFDDRTITFALHISNNDNTEQPNIEHGVSVFIQKFKEGRIVIKNICGANVTKYDAKLYIVCADKGWLKIATGNSSYCEQCEYGSYQTNDQCLGCPIGTYNTKLGSTECLPCPQGQTTLSTNSFSINHCIEICKPGFFSVSGTAPCKLCDIGQYQSEYNSTYCKQCPPNTSTVNYGSKSIEDCLAECSPGFFSRTGYEPCKECPKGFYQPVSKQCTCLRCPTGTSTLFTNTTSHLFCKELSCGEVDCLNGGRCVAGRCICANGYAGADCGILLNLCSANYCLNGGTCNYNGTVIACACQLGYYGNRCEKKSRRKRSLIANDNNECVNGLYVHSAYNNSYFDWNSGYINPETTGKQCIPKVTPIWHYANVSDPLYTSIFHHKTLKTRMPTSNFHMIRKRSTSNGILDPCKNLACNNGGICYVVRDNTTTGGEQPKCLCQPGTTGDICELSTDICSKSHCKNGSCIPMNNTIAEYYFCKCSDSAVRGEYCDVFAPCSQNPIYSDSSYFTECYSGVCHLDNINGKTSCSCYTGFDGPQCTNAVDYCNPNPCNGQTCHSKYNGYSCECDNDEYTGTNCTFEIDPCTRMPCANGGSCIMLTRGHYGQYKCNCPSGWEGEQCHRLTDECQTALCADGSTCATVSNHSYVCFCPNGQKGRYCDETIDYCTQLKPCLNNGRCIRTLTEAGYRCDCADGYAGKMCEYQMDFCNPNPCQNGGLCIDKEQNYTCSCLPNYSGRDCEIFSDPCFLENGEPYCFNNGECSVQNGIPTCQCTNLFAGDQCQTEKKDNFNLFFTGYPSEKSIVSQRFDASVLNLFTLCFWVNPGSVDTVWNPDGSSNSTFLTVATFNLQSYGSELISINTNGVRLERTYLLPFTLNEREWHHVCVRADQDDGVDILINGNEILHSQQHFSDNSLPALILLGKNINSTEHFIGQISLVQMFSIALATEEIFRMYNTCDSWINEAISPTKAKLVIDWKDFTTVDRQDTFVFVLYPGICGTNECSTGDCIVSNNDKLAPVANNCPEDVYIVSEKRLSVVTWNPNRCDDIFVDNVQVAYCTSNYHSGDVFAWGGYHILYVAHDYAGNVGLCHFEVTVSPKTCNTPDDPLHGKAKFRDFTTREARKVATLTCDESYMFAREVPQFFICDVMGRWTRSPYGLRYRFPHCSEYTTPEQTVTGLIELTGRCSTVKKFERDLQDAVVNACNQRSAEPSSEEQDCSSLKISSNCSNRFKRSTNSTTATNVKIRYSIRNLSHEPVVHVLNNTVREAFPDALHEIKAEWRCTDDFPMLYTKNSQYSCIKCSKGQFYNETSGLCEECPLNTYKEEEGRGECTSCPDNLITGATGAMLPSDCYRNCTPGQYYSDESGNCELCEKGRYQMEYGSTECYPCPLGSTTSATGSRAQNECNIYCAAGMVMNTEEKCVLCDPGTYRTDDHRIVTCVSCNIGFSSEAGSTSPYDCKIRFCPVGYFLNEASSGPVNQVDHTLEDFCIKCKFGTYQNVRNATHCIHCPSGTTTTFEGATSPRDCIIAPSTPQSSSTTPTPEPVVSSVWYIWIIVSVAVSVAVVLLCVLGVFYRKPMANCVMFWTSRNLKNFETTDYYRHETYPTPTTTTLQPSTARKVMSSSTHQSQMTEIYDQIFTGLQQMADGSEDSRSKDFDEVESYSRSHHTMETYPDNFYDPQITVETSSFQNEFGIHDAERQDFRISPVNPQSFLRNRYFEPASMSLQNEHDQWYLHKTYSRENFRHGLCPQSVADDDDDEDYFG